MVVGDWDADGVVSTAIIVYVQEKLGVFPSPARTPVTTEPSGPRSIGDLLKSTGCYEYLVLLDIPYTQGVYDALREYKSRGCARVTYYFDHHKSTGQSISSLESLGVNVVFGKTATSMILKNYLEGIGVNLPKRLKDYSLAVAVIEGGRGLAKHGIPQGLVKVVSEISKVLNNLRDSDLWRKYVKWLSSPLPLEPPKPVVDSRILDAGDIAQEADEEVRRAAMELAMTAVNLGYARLVDARGKWRKRGSSALASWIHRIVGVPVALLVEKNNGVNLVIIRSSDGISLTVLEKLAAQGLVTDVGGHPNLAIARLAQNIGLNELASTLRRLFLEVYSNKAGMNSG